MLRETEEALADLEAGRVVSGVEVMQWLETWGTEGDNNFKSLARQGISRPLKPRR